MAHITGEWRPDTGLKVWKNLRLSINNYTSQASKDLVHRAEYDLKRWESDLISEISDPLAKAAWHTLRDPTRLWPYMNTGAQIASIDTHVKMHTTGAGNYAITAWAEIGKPYASFTNDGYPRRKDRKTPRWVGWMDRVFYGGDTFFSVSEIFDRLVVERQGVI